MIEIQHHFQLKEHNTFGISAFAKAYIPAVTLQQLKEAVSYYQEEDLFILGGGSNMLLINDVERPVLHVLLKGIEILDNNQGKVRLKVMAGENWHDLVMYCIQNNFAGIENLALIPGNAGTSPIQNIGAYGVELKDTFHSCEVIEVATGKEETLTKADCNFGYRDSIFKNVAAGKYIITSITLELTDLNKTSDYKLKTNYGAIQEEMDQLPGENSISKVAQAVVNIRTNKLPDPKVIGNSGSFFKNPIISRTSYNDLIRMHPQMPCYEVDAESVKVPAGWLIDKSGFKGKRYGDAGVHDRQALVLVNHGKATGKEILEVAKKIQEAVQLRFGISIETEVNLIEN
ncbi:UDP-N-acetylmuramate dehydrogenase [Nonlabens marinus]|uniref:UDP-N-acetylenolpyruvoylglucosamine reductase n=1 Tax=Nonlabens marinus S1-08 TaxID=1454201 RepID=W8VP64_9FLAO|nr:UDP-N-acetylmuramate dehydrogenase [Nonlabens marinus]BAO54280.1 UDP-N-acetylenolpyruvoylglucosamine reductase [Nonlabens marinus S1-08]